MAEPTNDAVSDERLRECPFCGWKPDTHHNSTEANIYCPNPDCGHGQVHVWAENVSNWPDPWPIAIAAWNRRSVTSQASEGAPVPQQIIPTVDWMTTRLPADAIEVAKQQPPWDQEVLVWVSDPGVSIFYYPAVARWNGHTWWSGVPAHWIDLLAQNWQVSHWRHVAAPASPSRRVERLEAIKECATIAHTAHLQCVDDRDRIRQNTPEFGYAQAKVEAVTAVWHRINELLPKEPSSGQALQGGRS